MQVEQPAITLSKKEQKSIRSSVGTEGPRLLNFIKRKVRSLEDAEDILQDVFVQLINSYDTIRNPENLTAWMYGVARNKISDYTKKRRVDSFTQHESNSDYEMPELLLLFESNPEDEMFTKMIREEIESAVNELPFDQRDVFVRTEIEGESFRSISEESGEKLNTLLSRKRYAVLHLRRRLQQLFDELTD